MAIPTPEWFYLRNVFNNVTSSNNKRMLSLSRDHRDKLFQQSATDPEIEELYLLMQPAYVAFKDQYAKVNNNFALYNSATKQVEILASELNKNIKTWDINIQNVFADDTVEYKGILPNGRKFFQSGTYDQRMSALDQLILALQAYPANPSLSAVLTLVQTFSTNFQEARSKQQGYEGDDSLFRNQLEVTRERLAVVMHRILGKLIFLYADTPATIEAYYELHYLRAAPPSATSAATVDIAANSRLQAMSGIYTQDDEFELANAGTTPLGFFITENELVATPDDLTVMQPGAKQTYTLSELSDGTPSRMLIVVNINNVKGRFRAALVQQPALVQEE